MELLRKICITSMVLLLLLFGLSGCLPREDSLLLILSSESEVSHERVKEAALAWGKEKGVRLEVSAPILPVASEQQKVLEQALKDNWDVICIEPIGGAELEPLLEYARDSGTIVVSAKNGGRINADYNIEPFSREEMGKRIMDALAASMEERGLFLTTIPSLEDKELIEIENAAIRRQQIAYGTMLPVSRLEVTGNSLELAANAAEQSYEKYMIGGALFFSRAEGVGIANWNSQNGSPVAVVGIGSGELLERELELGNIDALFCWNREALICAALDIGYYAVSGRQAELGDVIRLPYDGYENMRRESENTWVANDIRQSFKTVSK